MLYIDYRVGDAFFISKVQSNFMFICRFTKRAPCLYRLKVCLPSSFALARNLIVLFGYKRIFFSVILHLHDVYPIPVTTLSYLFEAYFPFYLYLFLNYCIAYVLCEL